MPVISIYSTDSGIRQQLSEQFAALAREGPEMIRSVTYSSFSAFLSSGRENPRRILLLAQTGASSVELISTAVEECPHNQVVWLSDLDFGLFSYRLEVAYFGFLPSSREALSTALRNCQRDRRRKANAPP